PRSALVEKMHEDGQRDREQAPQVQRMRELQHELSRFPASEQLEQDPVGRLIGGNLLHFDVGAGQLLAAGLEKTPEFRQVALTDLARLGLDLAVVLHAQEAGRIVEGKIQLLAIVDLQEKDVVAARSQHF